MMQTRQSGDFCLSVLCTVRRETDLRLYFTLRLQCSLSLNASESEQLLNKQHVNFAFSPLSTDSWYVLHIHTELIMLVANCHERATCNG